MIDGSPKDGHYPYHPGEGQLRLDRRLDPVQHPVQRQPRLSRPRQHPGHGAARRRCTWSFAFEAPLNFDYAKVESGKVWATTSAGDTEFLWVTEESTNSQFLGGRLQIQADAEAKAGDGILQVPPGGTVEVGYGYGYLARRATARF